MKTIEELYNEVLASDELKREFLTLKADQVEAFVKAHGCEATFDEVKAFFEMKKNSAEFSENELGQVAGGKSASAEEALMSVFYLGVGCAAIAFISAVAGKCGTAIEGEGMLCTPE